MNVGCRIKDSLSSPFMPIPPGALRQESFSQQSPETPYLPPSTATTTCRLRGSRLPQRRIHPPREAQFIHPWSSLIHHSSPVLVLHVSVLVNVVLREQNNSRSYPWSTRWSCVPAYRAHTLSNRRDVERILAKTYRRGKNVPIRLFPFRLRGYLASTETEF